MTTIKLHPITNRVIYCQTAENLRWADFSGANLRGANLSGANLHWANLSRANLSGANLHWANLSRANLSRANLHCADLSKANLRGANLREADLRGANLDFSVWPLWCGSFGVIVDRNIVSQLAYHFCCVDCDDQNYAKARAALIELANSAQVRDRHDLPKVRS